MQKDNPSLSRWTLSTYQFNRQWEFSWLALNMTPLKYQKAGGGGLGTVGGLKMWSIGAQGAGRKRAGGAGAGAGAVVLEMRQSPVCCSC